MKSPYYIKARDGRWHYIINMPDIADSAYHSTGIKVTKRNQSAAETYVLREIERRKADTQRKRFGSYTPAITRELTIREYAADFYKWEKCRWIEAQHRAGLSFKEVTARQRRGHLEKYIFPLFGDRVISSLPAIELEEYLLSQPIKNATRKQIISSYAIIAEDAKRHGVISQNPMSDRQKWSMSDRTPKIKLSNEDIETLFPQTLEQWRRVWPVEMYGVLFAVMLSAGLRIGEVRALRWGSVLWQVRAIAVTAQIGKFGEESVPKKREVRGVLLPRRTIRLLAAWRHYGGVYAPDSYIFTNYRFKRPPLIAQTIQGQLQKALDNAGITKHITPHSLRYTYNTRMRGLLLKGELSEDFLRQLTGHRSVAMSDHYDLPDVDERITDLAPARRQIEKFWNK